VDIAKTNKLLAESEAKLLSVKKAIPYSVHDEIKATNEVESYKRGLEFAKRILKARF
jgi:soluble cytochrome b562